MKSKYSAELEVYSDVIQNAMRAKIPLFQLLQAQTRITRSNKHEQEILEEQDIIDVRLKRKEAQVLIKAVQYLNSIGGLGLTEKEADNLAGHLETELEHPIDKSKQAKLLAKIDHMKLHGVL